MKFKLFKIRPAASGAETLPAQQPPACMRCRWADDLGPHADKTCCHYSPPGVFVLAGKELPASQPEAIWLAVEIDDFCSKFAPRE